VQHKTSLNSDSEVGEALVFEGFLLSGDLDGIPMVHD